MFSSPTDFKTRTGWGRRTTARSTDGGKGSLPWGSRHPTPRTQTRRPEPVHCPARLPSALPVPYSLHPTTRCLPAPTSACPPALPLCPARGHPCPCPLPCARGVELALRVHSTAVRPRRGVTGTHSRRSACGCRATRSNVAMRVGTLLELQSSTGRWLDGPRVAFAQLWPRPHRAAPGSWLIPATPHNFRHRN